MPELSELLVGGSVVCFTPDPGWTWVAWDGRVSPKTRDERITVQGRRVALETDLHAMGTELLGRAYAATGFEDIPGQVTATDITVDEPTLSALITVGGLRAAVKVTRGRFVATCRPSIRSGLSPTPDPNPVKTGTWTIEQAGQARVETR